MQPHIHKFLDPLYDIVLWLLLGNLLIQCYCKRPANHPESDQITLSRSQADDPTRPSENLPIYSLPDEQNFPTTQASNETLENALKKFIEEIEITKGIEKEEILKGINRPIKDILGNNLNFLQAAVALGHKEYVQQLLKVGADINVQDNHQYTVLHIAAERGDLEVIKVLLSFSKSLKLDLTNDLGKTALHLAVEKGDLAIVKALVNKKTAKDILDKAGKKPIDLAREKQKELAVDSKELQNYQAIINELSGFLDKASRIFNNPSQKLKNRPPSTSTSFVKLARRMRGGPRKSRGNSSLQKKENSLQKKKQKRTKKAPQDQP